MRVIYFKWTSLWLLCLESVQLTPSSKYNFDTFFTPQGIVFILNLQPASIPTSRTRIIYFLCLFGHFWQFQMQATFGILAHGESWGSPYCCMDQHWARWWLCHTLGHLFLSRWKPRSCNGHRYCFLLKSCLGTAQPSALALCCWGALLLMVAASMTE